MANDASPRLILEHLPTEIQTLILHHLPFPSLLTFALTSRRNYELSRSTLSTLHFAVFPKRIHAVLAFLNADSSSFLDENDNSARYQIAVATNPSCQPKEAKTLELRSKTQAPLLPPPQVQRQSQIESQNQTLAQVLSSSILRHLSNLTIHTYSLNSHALASTIATKLPHLRHLNLNFSHPYIHDSILPAHYWETCPTIPKEGTPAWNHLAGLGGQHATNLKLRSLETLTLNRAALTSAQLAKWIESNPNLRKISLTMVSGVDKSFMDKLVQLRGRQGLRAPLQSLELRRCPNLNLQKPEDFEFIQALLAMGLRELDLRGCKNVAVDVLRQSCEGRGWTKKGGLKVIYPDDTEDDEDDDDDTKSLDERMLVPDYGTEGITKDSKWANFPTSERIEVDPVYL